MVRLTRAATDRNPPTSGGGGCQEDNDPALFQLALQDVARARGMKESAKEAGVSEEALQRLFSVEAAPDIPNFLKMLKAFGLVLRYNSTI